MGGEGEKGGEMMVEVVGFVFGMFVVVVYVM